MVRISRGAQVPENVVQSMVQQTWKVIAPVDDKLDFNAFQAQLSTFDLHTLMTVDF